MPAEVSHLPEQDSHPQAGSEVGEALFVLGLSRASRPLFLSNDVTKMVKLGSGQVIPGIHTGAVRTLKPDDSGIGCKCEGGIEARLSYVQANLFELPSCRISTSVDQRQNQAIRV